MSRNAFRPHKALVSRCDALEAEVVCLRAKVARLQAIVDRLPKTADGVPVAIGDIVFWRDPIRTYRINDAPFQCQCGQHYYSTRKAAEAEKAKP